MRDTQYIETPNRKKQMDANTLNQAAAAIETLTAAGLMSKRAATQAKQALLQKLNQAMTQWSDREQWDIVESLNATYRKLAA